jgi:hypothetical protein
MPYKKPMPKKPGAAVRKAMPAKSGAAVKKPMPARGKAKESKPVLLGGVKKTGEDALWGPMTSTRRPSRMISKPKSAKEMSATYRKKAQATRLTPAQRRAAVQREKDRLMDEKGKITSSRFKGSM